MVVTLPTDRFVFFVVGKALVEIGNGFLQIAPADELMLGQTLIFACDHGVFTPTSSVAEYQLVHMRDGQKDASVVLGEWSFFLIGNRI